MPRVLNALICRLAEIYFNLQFTFNSYILVWFMLSVTLCSSVTFGYDTICIVKINFIFVSLYTAHNYSSEFIKKIGRFL
jgi:hypothetical protein